MTQPNIIPTLSDLKAQVDALPVSPTPVLFCTAFSILNGDTYLPGTVQYQVEVVKGEQGATVISAKKAKVQKNLKVKMKDLDLDLIQNFIS